MLAPEQATISNCAPLPHCFPLATDSSGPGALSARWRATLLPKGNRSLLCGILFETKFVNSLPVGPSRFAFFPRLSWAPHSLAGRAAEQRALEFRSNGKNEPKFVSVLCCRCCHIVVVAVVFASLLCGCQADAYFVLLAPLAPPRSLRGIACTLAWRQHHIR